MDRSFPDVSIETPRQAALWDTARRYVSPVESVLHHRGMMTSPNSVHIAHLMEKLGSYYAVVVQDDLRALTYYFHAHRLYQQIHPSGHPDHAQCLGTIGKIYDRLHMTPQALQYYQATHAMYQDLFPGNHPATARWLSNLGIFYTHQKDHAAALSWRQQALDMQYQLHGDRDHEEVARCLRELSSTHLRLNDPTTALHYLQSALSMYQRIGPSTHYEPIALCYHGLAQIHTGRQEPLAALWCHRQALQHYQMLSEQGGGKPSVLARLLLSVGDGLYHQQKPAEALPYYQKTLAIERTLQAPTNTDWTKIHRLERLIERVCSTIPQ